ncbi:hypothetical protein HK104_006710, partial [Borealophlyctis nickersoniae]
MVQIDYHTPVNQATWTPLQAHITWSIGVVHTVLWVVSVGVFVMRRGKYAIKQTGVGLTVLGSGAAVCQNGINFYASGALLTPCFLYLWANYFGFFIIDLSIIARAFRLIRKVQVGKDLVARSRRYSADVSLSAAGFQGSTNVNVANRANPASSSSSLSPTCVALPVLPNIASASPLIEALPLPSSPCCTPPAVNASVLRRAASLESTDTTITIAPPESNLSTRKLSFVISTTGTSNTTSAIDSAHPFPHFDANHHHHPFGTFPEPISNTTSPGGLPSGNPPTRIQNTRSIDAAIWRKTMVAIGVAFIVTLILQCATRKQRLWPAIDVGSCQPGWEFLPMYLWRTAMSIGSGILIWKLRGVRDAHGIRRDLLITAWSGSVITALFIVSVVLTTKLPVFRAYMYYGHWVILHLTIIQTSSVVFPIIQSYKDDRFRRHQVRLDRESFEKVVKTPSLLQEFKVLAVA